MAMSITITITSTTTSTDADPRKARVDGASGEDDRRCGVEACGRGVIEVATRVGVQRVLCDERALRYRIGIGDTWAASSDCTVAVQPSASTSLSLLLPVRRYLRR
jgi:hypothetical protein